MLSPWIRTRNGSLWVVGILVATGLAGCVGSGTASGTYVAEVKASVTQDGLGILIFGSSAPPSGMVARVEAPGGMNRSFPASRWHHVEANEYAIPDTLRPGPSINVTIERGSKTVAQRRIVLVDLETDQQPALGYHRLGAQYMTYLSEHRKADGQSYAESERGIDTVLIQKNGTTVRSFEGTGHLQERLGPLFINATLTRVSRTIIAGVTTRSLKEGHGTWSAVWPAEGNGTIDSYRQDLAGMERLEIAGREPMLLKKENIGLVLNGTLIINGTSSHVAQTVFWTTWADPASGDVRWARQRPAQLVGGSIDATSEGPPPAIMAPSAQPWTLKGRFPYPLSDADRFSIQTWDGTNATATISAPFTTVEYGRNMTARAWSGPTIPHVKLFFNVVADPNADSLPLSWGVTTEASATVSYSQSLVKFVTG